MPKIIQHNFKNFTDPNLIFHMCICLRLSDLSHISQINLLPISFTAKCILSYEPLKNAEQCWQLSVRVFIINRFTADQQQHRFKDQEDKSMQAKIGQNKVVYLIIIDWWHL